MAAQPEIGKWYQIRGSDEFEVVAIDEADGTIEVQYFDGTVEEMELSDWQAQSANGEVEEVEPQEDSKGSADFDDDDNESSAAGIEGPNLSGGLEDLDMFEAHA